MCAALGGTRWVQMVHVAKVKMQLSNLERAWAFSQLFIVTSHHRVLVGFDDPNRPSCVPGGRMPEVAWAIICKLTEFWCCEKWLSLVYM